MKRNKVKVPEFDEIIFENRNKAYGAYDLRKRYKSAAGLSIIGGIAISAILMTAISLTTEDGKASDGITSVVIVMADPTIPVFDPPEVVKPPAELIKVISNLIPEVTDDTAQLTSYIPTVDDVLITAKDGKVTDTIAFTQTPDVVIPVETPPSVIVQEMPEYPGGLSALLSYVGENLNYPPDAQNNNIEGKVVLKFVVNADGSVDRIELMRSIDPLLDNEAIRVVKTLPKFKPGKQNGVAVPVWFTLPVVFKLQKN